MLISFYIITYNQSSYIEEALLSAFSQTYKPLQIVISDDASTDGTQSKIEKMIEAYAGPHKIKYIKNKKNLGISRHILNVIKECDGEYIIASAGDDISESNRAEILYNYFTDYPDIMLLQSYLTEIDSDGTRLYLNTLNDNFDYPEKKVIRWSYKNKIKGFTIPHTHGAGFAYSKKLLHTFPLILDNAIIFEDNVFDWRAELMNAIGMVRISLVKHRNHDSQATKQEGEGNRAALLHMQRIAASDVSSTEMNIRDLEHWSKISDISPDDYECCRRWLERRLDCLKRKSDILHFPWPQRLFPLACYSLRPNNQFSFHKRELIKLFIP